MEDNTGQKWPHKTTQDCHMALHFYNTYVPRNQKGFAAHYQQMLIVPQTIP